ncbi:MAG: hypothetical protein IJF24_01810 [Clostridia bacterium]|nr:hypothetical protein [Clostridia bacterium]
MEKLSWSAARKNVRNNVGLLLSGLGLLCLTWSVSLVSLALCCAVAAALLAASAFDVTRTVCSSRAARAACVLPALLLAFLGLRAFRAAHAASAWVSALSAATGLGTSLVLICVGGLFCLIGFFALYTLTRVAVYWFSCALDRLFPASTSSVRSLKKNWIFPLSGLSLFCLTVTKDLTYLIGIPVTGLILIAVFMKVPDAWAVIRQKSRAAQIACALCALGICLGNQEGFYKKMLQLCEAMHLSPKFESAFLVLGYVGAAAAFFFVYFALSLFFREFGRLFDGIDPRLGVRRSEWIFYGALLTLVLGFVTFSFLQSEAFYGTEYFYDLLYSSDSPSLVKGNAYVWLTHPENDLRQPLFAVFSAPFTAIPYLFSRIFCVSESVRAILINSMQIVLLFAANFLISRAMRLSALRRACFMTLSVSTYAQLLFSVMMEQYVVAYFWLAVCLYVICETSRAKRLAVWGVGGTLLTGAVLLPALSERSPKKNFFAYVFDLAKYGLEFFALWFVFCRFDVVLNVFSRVGALSGYTGKAVTLTEKLYQFTHFVRNIFVSPAAGEATVGGHPSWQLLPADGVSILGTVLLILALLSAVCNRDKKDAVFSGVWVAFSVLLLFVLGWGTKENGLILYALYFGWAYLVLLFRLFEKIEAWLSVRFLIPLATAAATATLLLFNIPAMAQLLQFATTNYPV